MTVAFSAICLLGVGMIALLTVIVVNFGWIGVLYLAPFVAVIVGLLVYNRRMNGRER